MPNIETRSDSKKIVIDVSNSIPASSVQVPQGKLSLGSAKALAEIRGSIAPKIAAALGVIALTVGTVGFGVYRLNTTETVIPELDESEQWAKSDPFAVKKPKNSKDKILGYFKHKDLRDKETRKEHVARVMKERVEFLMGVQHKKIADEYDDLPVIEEKIDEHVDQEFPTEEARWNFLRKGYMRVYPTHTMRIMMNLPLPVPGRAALIGKELQEIYVRKVVDYSSNLKKEFPDVVQMKEMQMEGGAVKQEEVVDHEQVLQLFLESFPRWRNEKYAYDSIKSFAVLYPKHLLENGEILKGLFTEQERADIVFTAAQKCPHEALKALKMDDKDMEIAKIKAGKGGNPYDYFQVNEKYKDVISSATQKSLFLASITSSPNAVDCNK